MEKKERNKRIGIIAAMVALIILIMCLGGNTFAKYISSKEVPTTSATVAKWGYTVEANAKGLFATSSAKGVQHAYVTPDTTTGAASVDVNATTEKVGGKDNFMVAPGTNGKLTFSIHGNAEVASKIVLKAESGELTVGTDGTLAAGKKATEVSLTDSTDSTHVYYPMKWTLKKSATDVSDFTSVAAVTGGDGVSLDEMIRLLNTLYTGTVNPNSAVINDYYELSWTWAFEDTTDAKYNKYDTILGQAVEENKTSIVDDNGTPTDTSDDITYTVTTTVELSLSISVVQVQVA